MSADIDVFDGSRLREIIVEEAGRLRTIASKFYGKAVELIDQDAVSDAKACAETYLKAVERLGVLVGLNAPQAHAIHLAVTAEPQSTSTDRIAAVIDRLCAESDKGEPAKPN